MRITLRLAGFVLAGLATFFVGVFLPRALVRLHREPSAWQILLSFENQDLKGLDEKSSAVLQKAVTAVTGHVRENQLSAYAPRLFRTISNTIKLTRCLKTVLEEVPRLVHND